MTFGHKNEAGRIASIKKGAVVQLDRETVERRKRRKRQDEQFARELGEPLRYESYR